MSQQAKNRNFPLLFPRLHPTDIRNTFFKLWFKTLKDVKYAGSNDKILLMRTCTKRTHLIIINHIQKDDPSLSP